MKKWIARSVFAIFIFIGFWGCKKNEDVDNCAQIQKVEIVTGKTSVYTGDTIWLQTNIIPPISLYNWSRGPNSNLTWSDSKVFIYPCTKNDEGWYFLNVSYPDCAYKNDSIYITVLNRPVTPPCSPADNEVSLSALSDLNFSSTSYVLDPSFNCKLLSGNASGYPAFNIYLNAYWNNREPEDGAYNIQNQLDFNGYDPYSVYMNTSDSGILFEANPGKVYVTHESGKLKISFCNITLSGNLGGPSFSTSATGAIVAP
jgi:hypothetical protein